MKNYSSCILNLNLFHVKGCLSCLLAFVTSKYKNDLKHYATLFHFKYIIYLLSKNIEFFCYTSSFSNISYVYISIVVF